MSRPLPPNRPRKRPPLGPFGWVLIAASLFMHPGCTELPEGKRIEYIRPLGLKARVVSSLFQSIDPQDPRPLAEALPLDTVALSALIASPQGALPLQKMSRRWIACELLPEKPAGTCLRQFIDEKDPLLQNIPACPTQTALNPNDFSSSIANRNLPCWVNVDNNEARYQVLPSVNMLLGTSIEFTLIASPVPGRPLQSCIDPFLQGGQELPDDCVYGFTRLPIGPRQKLAQLLREVGAALPDGLENAPENPQGPIPKSDRHTRINRGWVTPTRDGQRVGPQIQLADNVGIQAPLGSTLEVQFESLETELQEFPVEGNEEAGQEIRREEYVGNAYISWGRLSVDPRVGDRSQANWELQADDDEEEKKPGDIVHLYYILRDGRSGIAWKSVAVRLTE